MTGEVRGRVEPKRGPAAGDAGFSLPELLLALALGLTLAIVVIQGLQGAGRWGARWMLQLRERQTARRTLALMRDELKIARNWETGPGSGRGAECPLGGRNPVLRLEVGGRQITYSIGASPSRIWRGGVLMRCGPAYDLTGTLSAGLALNRVVIDGMETAGLEASAEGPKVLRLTLRRLLQLKTGATLILTNSIIVAVPDG